MQTQLIKFRIQNFRSIIDSGWVDVFENTCLIGTNESGKTNLLIGLWKLNPANNEEINPLIDYPRKKYVDYATTKGEEIFVSGHYKLNQESNAIIRGLFKKEQTPISTPEKQGEEIKEPAPLPQIEIASAEEVSEIIVFRTYSGIYTFSFPKMDDKTKIQIKITSEAQKKILKTIPKFVYYSDYGNLDSEIYLPYVIANFKRQDLGIMEKAKVRSLKVLFEFVKLSPDDILRLGQEKFEVQTTIKVHQNDPAHVISRNSIEIKPTEQEIESQREHKKEREILLQSASSKLTKQFKEWWKQGDYRFRFQADGNHFRIWVSDDLRPEEVELEGRSKGLQWFFSFFLVFLVESKDTHSNCILLLDEPGLSLHPIAQFDLIKFFNSLSNQNQIIYTTHSPFLVSPENLANVKAVFVDKEGTSSVSSDLRKNSTVAEKSIFPVHAAIGLTISETLLLGCQPVLVEGQSDQIYLQIIKNHLSGLGKYKNAKEIVFIPTGGVRGMTTVISIVSGRENDLPFAILDSDKQGKEKADKLIKDTYKLQPGKIIEVDSLLTEKGEFELEDIFPYEELAKIFSKRYRGKNDDFDYLVTNNVPIIQQMEKFAIDNEQKLEVGWKVQLAIDFHNQFQHIAKKIKEDTIRVWSALFDKLTQKT